MGAIGLGAMPLSEEGRPSDRQAIATMHAALDAGVTIIDTADAYCLNGTETGHNERLVARALREWTGDADSVIVATKGGHVRDREGRWLVDGSPTHLRAACEASLLRLKMESIPLYQFHRPDPRVPYEESLTALVELRDEGKVQMIGISNADVCHIQSSMHAGIVSVQNEFSPDFTSSRAEIELCEEAGLSFLAWAPLGGIARAASLNERHPAFADVARELRVPVQEVVLAWALRQSPCVIPIPGCRRPETILSSVHAANVELSGHQLRALDSSTVASA